VCDEQQHAKVKKNDNSFCKLLQLNVIFYDQMLEKMKIIKILTDTTWHYCKKRNLLGSLTLFYTTISIILGVQEQLQLDWSQRRASHSLGKVDQGQSFFRNEDYCGCYSFAWKSSFNKKKLLNSTDTEANCYKYAGNNHIYILKNIYNLSPNTISEVWSNLSSLLHVFVKG
jgi:hypothetical protein